MTRGAVLVAYGAKAERFAQRAQDAARNVCPDLPVQIRNKRIGGLTDMQKSRLAKVTLLDWTPFDHTVYMDADTVANQDFSVGFDILDDGWDLALAPSSNQCDKWLWHVSDDERAQTRTNVGDSLQLQAGVFFVARNDRTRALWHAWRQEWERWQGQDQGALLRALYRVPVKVWLLGHVFNGGAVIGHSWGAIR